MKQSSRCWNAALHERLLKIGFQQLAADACVYSRTVKGHLQIITIYVDDIVVVAKTQEGPADLKQPLASWFRIKDLGKLNFLLGVKVQHMPAGLCLSQEAYVNSIIKRFDMQDANPVDTPANSNVILIANDGCSQEVDRGAYQQVVGSLLYAAMAM